MSKILVLSLSYFSLLLPFTEPKCPVWFLHGELVFPASHTSVKLEQQQQGLTWSCRNHMDTWKEVLKLRFSGEQFMASRRPLPINFKWQGTRAMSLAFYTDRTSSPPACAQYKSEEESDGKNSQELSAKCSLLFLLSPPRHCTQSEIRIYCHFADDSRGSDLLSQKNNESSAQSTVKHGLWVALFPCLPIYLRTVKSIMSINTYKLAGRRWVDISNPEQVPDAFSEINSVSTTFSCVYLADEDPLA